LKLSRHAHALIQIALNLIEQRFELRKVFARRAISDFFRRALLFPRRDVFEYCYVLFASGLHPIRNLWTLIRIVVTGGSEFR
jgi:hypothetical protein